MHILPAALVVVVARGGRVGAVAVAGVGARRVPRDVRFEHADENRGQKTRQQQHRHPRIGDGKPVDFEVARRGRYRFVK